MGILPVKVNPSNQPQTATPPKEEATLSESPPSQTDSMQEYYQLKQTLFLVTLALTGVIFISVWISYSVNTALNYLLGACVGVVYLRMLAKDVERLGEQKKRVSSNRLALFIGLFVVATQWQQLEILPIFLGFMTYKAAILVYVIQSTLSPK